MPQHWQEEITAQAMSLVRAGRPALSWVSDAGHLTICCGGFPSVERLAYPPAAKEHDTCAGCFSPAHIVGLIKVANLPAGLAGYFSREISERSRETCEIERYFARSKLHRNQAPLRQP